ncbi:MAG: hypothetical protein L0Y72_17730 [Gemmataceae bacterium]|nr:hypothetical protein [Gemmataceae bacterium]MCI0740893.1 hypothetical protein [Gemmataceae bacterium]
MRPCTENKEPRVRVAVEGAGVLLWNAKAKEQPKMVPKISPTQAPSNVLNIWNSIQAIRAGHASGRTLFPVRIFYQLASSLGSAGQSSDKGGETAAEQYPLEEKSIQVGSFLFFGVVGAHVQRQAQRRQRLVEHPAVNIDPQG